jgi:hypothetical protein
MQILDLLIQLYFDLYNISILQKTKLLFIFVDYLKTDKMQFLINIFGFTRTLELQSIILLLENSNDQLPTFLHLILLKQTKDDQFHKAKLTNQILNQP